MSDIEGVLPVTSLGESNLVWDFLEKLPVDMTFDWRRKKG